MGGPGYIPNEGREVPNPIIEGDFSNREAWMGELLAFNCPPAAAAEKKVFNPANPPHPKYNLDPNNLKPFDKTKPDGLQYHQFKGKVGDTDCEIDDFGNKVGDDFISSSAKIIYTTRKGDKIEPLKGLDIPFNGAQDIVGQNTREVRQFPIIVNNELKGYNCEIESYAERANDGSDDYLVQVTRCMTNEKRRPVESGCTLDGNRDLKNIARFIIPEWSAMQAWLPNRLKKKP